MAPAPVIATQSSPNHWQVQWLGWLGLLVTVIFTLGLWRYFSLDLQQRESERFRQIAERRVDALTDRMDACERILRGAAGFFAASDSVRRDEWRKYVSMLDLEKSLPGGQAVGFAVVIPKDDLAAHEWAVRAEGFPGYAVHPGGDRELYTSVLYVEPFDGRNLRAFGYDMYSEPTRRMAMERARDTGMQAMTRRVRLLQATDQDVQPGILIYLPVYDHTPAATLLERRRALVGWVYSPIRATDLMASVFREPVSDTEVTIYDGEPAPENVLYESPEAHRDADYVVDFTLDIAGVRWLARVRSSQTFEQRINRTRPQNVLLAGLMLTSLIFAVIYVDARNRRRLEAQVRERTAELESARDEAEGASRAKSAFLGTVSHELRTPLNAIIGFSSILLQDDVGAEQRKQLAIINRSGLHLLELIKEILDITSIEAGHLAIRPEPVELCGLIEEQCELLQAQARESGLLLQCAGCDDSLVVLVDRGRLSQVVRNLLANALKFTDHGSVTVRCVRDGGMARIEVEDTGIGIPVEYHSTLFNPFQRAGQGRSNRPGTGLGLAISRRLIEAMGGTIDFDSAVGRGSRFWCTVPLA